MENCILKLEIPSPVSLAASDSNKTIKIFPDEAEIEVWQTSTNEVDRLTSSTSTSPASRRPQNEFLKTTWVVRSGMTFETQQFDCPSGSLQTFELVCKSRDCDVQFQQDVYEPRLGTWLLVVKLHVS